MIAPTLTNTESSITQSIDARLIARLACIECGGALVVEYQSMDCQNCAAKYPVIDGIPCLRRMTALDKDETAAWSKHWADDQQQSFSQRFFSFYRKAIFARAVRHFVQVHFPAQGVFVEAGCGTSETSMRIEKNAGSRLLVAVDIVQAVLAKCHGVMDARICADIFHLPFRSNSIDGIWNVGVMEHFPHEQIDQMMREFWRVLKPGARLLLLWPATTSPPQKMLRVAEKIIHWTSGPKDFRFHPDEISQIRSGKQAREVLTRNGFDPIEINRGLRSLYAFKIIVGAKP